MSYPAQCPVCRTLLEFPEPSPYEPVRCPSCDTRFKLEGRQAAHLTFTDYYGMLGVSPDAPDVELGKAIRAKILEHHPDRNPDDPNATEKLREIVQAKELLGDPEKRKIYNSVYYAIPLARWAKARRRYQAPGADYSRREPPRQPRDREPGSSSPGWIYEEMTRSARKRSEHTSAENIEHLIDEIEVIFMQAGVPINVSGKHGMPGIRINDPVWRWIGTISLALAGMLYGMLNGSMIGTILLTIIGGVVGWILTSYPGGIVVLAFLTARIFIFGFLLALIASRVTSGFWFPENIKSVLLVIETGPLLGSIAFGLWGIGTSAMSARSPYIVHHLVHRQAVLGAWIGALLAVFFSLVDAIQDSQLQVIMGWWMVFFTVYLFLDTKIFGRSWVFIRDRG